MVYFRKLIINIFFLKYFIIIYVWNFMYRMFNEKSFKENFSLWEICNNNKIKVKILWLCTWDELHTWTYLHVCLCMPVRWHAWEQYVDYNKINFFLQQPWRNWGMETSCRPLCFLEKANMRLQPHIRLFLEMFNMFVVKCTHKYRYTCNGVQYVCIYLFLKFYNFIKGVEWIYTALLKKLRLFVFILMSLFKYL